MSSYQFTSMPDIKLTGTINFGPKLTDIAGLKTKINGQDYYYLPQDYIQKGVTASGDFGRSPGTYFSPQFLSTAFQQELKNKGTYVDLSNVSNPNGGTYGDYLGALGRSKTGYLVPATQVTTNAVENWQRANLGPNGESGIVGVGNTPNGIAYLRTDTQGKDLNYTLPNGQSYQWSKPTQTTFQKFISDLGPLPTIATAIFAPQFLPLVSGAQTAIQGGDLGDVLTSAGKSYVLGQIGQQAGIYGDQASAAAQYGTDLGSAQTAMLAAQEAGMGSLADIAGNLAANTAMSSVSSALTGRPSDPLTALATAGASAAAPLITGQIEGFSSLPSIAQNAINSVVASEMTGKDPTNALISSALQAGKNAYQNYSLSDIANIGSNQSNVTTPAFEPTVTPVPDQTNIIGTPLPNIGFNQQTTDNQGQPENIGILDYQFTQSQAPETQQIQNDVVTNTNLQDNQLTASGQGNNMDILDFLGGDTSPDNIDIGGGWNPAGVDTSFDNIDVGGGWNPAGNIYDQISQDDINAMADVGMNIGEGADINAMGDVGMGSPTGGGSTGGGGATTPSGGTALSAFLKGLMPTTALGKAALASGAGGVLQGLIGANASTKAAQIQADAARAALAQQQSMFNTLNQQQAPYRGAGYGALNQIQGMLPGQYTQYDAQGNPMGMATGTGYLTQQFTPELFQQGIDPGYAFRLQQGQMANQRMGNVSGGGLGGNVMRGLQDYTQGQASQEYQNAFNRYQTQRSNIYNTLAGIAGIGQTSQQQANTLGTNLANAQSNLGVGAAGAQAAGQIGQAGAYGGALGGINQALLLSQLPDIAAAMKGQ